MTSVAILSFSHINGDARVLRQIQYLAPVYAVSILGYGLEDGLTNGTGGGADNSASKGRPEDVGPRASCPSHTLDGQNARGPNSPSTVQTFDIHNPTSRQRRVRKAIFLPLGRFVSKKFYEWWYWREEEFQQAAQILIGLKPDIIHANDWESLPVAVRAAEETGAKIVLDLHEYAPAMWDNLRYWRLFYKPLIEHFLGQLINQADATVTVGEIIAERYQETYGVKPIVVMNAPLPRIEQDIAQNKKFDNSPQQIRLVHHGAAIRGRNLESLIEAIGLTDERFTLHFMLIARDQEYFAMLKKQAAALAPGRITFIDPVSPAEIVEAIGAYDMGFYLLPPDNFNQAAAMPNKFFDFVQAGLAVCIGPSLEMARIAKHHGFGVVADAFDATAAAAALNQLTAADVDAMKEGAINAGKAINADVELGKLLTLYETVTN